MKPASKKCKKCGDGLCKYCPAKSTTNYAGDWDGFICSKCEDDTPKKRGVVHI